MESSSNFAFRKPGCVLYTSKYGTYQKPKLKPVYSIDISVVKPPDVKVHSKERLKPI